MLVSSHKNYETTAAILHLQMQQEANYATDTNLYILLLNYEPPPISEALIITDKGSAHSSLTDRNSKHILMAPAFRVPCSISNTKIHPEI